MVVEHTVKAGDCVLDCGAGTGATALLAAQKSGAAGKVTLFDVSEGMLSVAKQRMQEAGLVQRCRLKTGDMIALPFADDTFDVVLSTYSVCPLYDPAKGALELERVVKPGGKIGVAHSTSPQKAWLRWLVDEIESVVWRFPALSLGCRPVSVLPVLRQSGCDLVFERRIGVPLWPFLVFVVRKRPKH